MGKWIVFFALSAAAIVLSCVGALAYRMSVKKLKRSRIPRFPMPHHIVFGGVFVAVYLALIPVRWEISGGEASVLQVLFNNMHNTFQVFTIDVDLTAMEMAARCPDQTFAAVYTAYVSVLYVVAPILTFGVIVSFFKNLSASLRCICSFWKKEVFILSKLNDKTLCLGRDLKRNHPDAVILYTSVFDDEEEDGFERTLKAKGFGAILFRKDITEINFGAMFPFASLKMVVIGENEAENCTQSLTLAKKYGERENTDLYVQSAGTLGELLMSNAIGRAKDCAEGEERDPKKKKKKGRIRIRRVDEKRALVYKLLDDRGDELFETAWDDDGRGGKLISAVIVGLGKYGTEMLKALAWYCQMDGYSLQIDAFDADEKALDRISAEAPELINGKCNGRIVPGEAVYDIRIHAGCDAQTKTFADEIEKLKSASFVFVCLGDDSANVRTAAYLRMLFERMKIKPVIRTVVYDCEMKRDLENAKNFKGMPYDILITADLDYLFSEDVIFNSSLEEEALALHKKYGGTVEDFWMFEYNIRSSAASVIHRKARERRGYSYSGKTEQELTSEDRRALESLEHRRWNAYMRGEGYIYSGSRSRATRNDLAKMHCDLVSYEELNDDDKRKDSRVGTK